MELCPNSSGRSTRAPHRPIHALSAQTAPLTIPTGGTGTSPEPQTPTGQTLPLSTTLGYAAQGIPTVRRQKPQDGAVNCPANMLNPWHPPNALLWGLQGPHPRSDYPSPSSLHPTAALLSLIAFAASHLKLGARLFGTRSALHLYSVSSVTHLGRYINKTASSKTPAVRAQAFTAQLHARIQSECFDCGLHKEPW